MRTQGCISPCRGPSPRRHVGRLSPAPIAFPNPSTPPQIHGGPGAWHRGSPSKLPVLRCNIHNVVTEKAIPVLIVICVDCKGATAILLAICFQANLGTSWLKTMAGGAMFITVHGIILRCASGQSTELTVSNTGEFSPPEVLGWCFTIGDQDFLTFYTRIVWDRECFGHVVIYVLAFPVRNTRSLHNHLLSSLQGCWLRVRLHLVAHFCQSFPRNSTMHASPGLGGHPTSPQARSSLHVAQQ
jgi:hypothetical protein